MIYGTSTLLVGLTFIILLLLLMRRRVLCMSSFHLPPIFLT